MEPELSRDARHAIKGARIVERQLANPAPSRALEEALRHNLRISTSEAHMNIGFWRAVVDSWIDCDDLVERMAALEAKVDAALAAPAPKPKAKRKRGRPKGSKNKPKTPAEGEDGVSG